MTKYAHVYFSPEEAELQRRFLLVMNNIRLITISREDIEEHYYQFVREHIGSDNRLVLHNQDEIDKFEYAMKWVLTGKEYELTDKPSDPQFADFVESSEKKAN